MSYTWNDGVNINSCDFTEVPTEIVAILPGDVDYSYGAIADFKETKGVGISSSSVVLIGSRQDVNDTTGVLFQVDFSKSLPRKCSLVVVPPYCSTKVNVSVRSRNRFSRQ